MSLAEILSTNKKIENKKTIDPKDITEERLLQNLDKFRYIISYWRWYPDKFVDFLCSLNPKNTFHLTFSQRIVLRCMLRYNVCYITVCRGYSKSFMAVLAQMIKCILYPGMKIFVAAGGKGQSAAIVSEKLNELCQLIPMLSKEVMWDTRNTVLKTRQTKDEVRYSFFSGSLLENCPATESARGRRYQAGTAEECVTINQDILQQVLIPTMTVQRRVNGQVDPREAMNQSLIYITTAGYRGTFAYDTLIETLCKMVGNPGSAFVLGGTWRLPVVDGLQGKDFIARQKMDGTYKAESFEREFESCWAGNTEKAFFDFEKLQHQRVLNLAETKYNNKIPKSGYYCMGVDVGRFNCQTEAVIIKVIPQANGTPLKQIVNIYSWEEEHFGLQAINLKRLFNQFKCKICVVDANGMGIGLVDFLLTDQQDPDTDEMLYNWGVYNDDEHRYKNFITPDTVHNAMYLMKANQSINSECYSYTQSQLLHGKLRFLIDERLAKEKLLGQAQGQKMSAEQRADYLRPYVQTSILHTQMVNMVSENDGANIILKPSSRKITHDKMSAMIYGLYWCKMQEDKSHKKKSRDLSKLMLFSPMKNIR